METLLECGIPVDAVNEHSIQEKKSSKPQTPAALLLAEVDQTLKLFLNYSENMYGKVQLPSAL
jgi:hypothetical protein